MKNSGTRKLCGLLGLAAKAGKVQSGEFCTEKSLKTRRAKLCIVASDASQATKKHLGDMCAYRNVPVFMEVLDKETLGHTIGKQMRASLVVEDAGFAEALSRLIEGACTGAEEQKDGQTERRARGTEPGAREGRQEGGYADGE